MTQINAYISFNGNCREAMNFYKESLGGGELSIQTVENSPAASMMPPEMGKSILHSQLIKDRIVIMGSDMLRDKRNTGNSVSLMMNCSSDKELRTFFENFSRGGKVIDPIADMFWGATFGTLIDKYGVTWMFSFDKNSKIKNN